jgi:hypothetical protein
MIDKANPWLPDEVDGELVERLASVHIPHAEAVASGVDIVGDPHRETAEGYSWTLLSRAKHVADVVPGSAVVMGSAIGSYVAKVVAWDFEASNDDPMVVLEIDFLYEMIAERTWADPTFPMLGEEATQRRAPAVDDGNKYLQ